MEMDMSLELVGCNNKVTALQSDHHTEVPLDQCTCTYTVCTHTFGFFFRLPLKSC